MIRRAVAPKTPEVVHERVDLPGARRFVRLGEEVSVRGLPGRYRWHGGINKDGSIAVYGGPAGHGCWRQVRLDRVRPHRTKRMRGSDE